MSIFETYVKFLDTKIQAIPKGSTLSFILSSRDVTLATAASRSESFVSRKRKKKDWLTDWDVDKRFQTDNKSGAFQINVLPPNEAEQH